MAGSGNESGSEGIGSVSEADVSGGIAGVDGSPDQFLDVNGGIAGVDASESSLRYQKIDKIIKKYEELEENADSEEEEDEESDKESDEEHDEEDEEEHGSAEEDEEEHDSLESDAGDYGITDEEEEDKVEDKVEDNHHDETYYTKYDDSMLWLHYMNTYLLCPVDGLYLKAGAIFREDGQCMCWSPAFPKVNKEEILNIWRAFYLPGNPELYLGGEKYIMIQVEPHAVMHGNKEAEAITIVRTLHMLVVGIYEEPMNRAQCDMRVRDMANVLESQGS